ncbi:MAG: SigE family RNA polymerase sigma factor [Nakamurella sp.]
MNRTATAAPVLPDCASFVRQHQSALFAFAVVLSGSRVEAEDVLAETFARVFQKWSRIACVDNPVAYVRRMVVNEFLSTRKTRLRTVAVADFADVADTKQDFTQQSADRDAMIHLIGGLPRQQQIVLALRYYYGLTDSEIADEVGITDGTVRGYASRALGSLRVDLGGKRRSAGNPLPGGPPPTGPTEAPAGHAPFPMVDTDPGYPDHS